MKRTLILFLLSSVLVTNVFAFCVNNETNNEVNISIKYDDWWVSRSMVVPPHTNNFCYMDDLKPHTYADYTLKIHETYSNGWSDDEWTLHWLTTSNLHFFKDKGDIQLEIDGTLF